MSINIERYINYLLFKTGSVTLDGIGTISHLRHPAEISPAKDIIHPPKSTFEFSEEIVEESNLSQLIEKNEKISSDKTGDLIREYSQEILNKLLNYNIVKVADVGYLEKQNNATVFIPSEKSLKQAYHGLASIPLKPISKKAIPRTTTIEQITAGAEKNGEWLNYFLALLIGGLMMLAHNYYFDPFDLSSRSSAKEISTSTNEESITMEKESLPKDENAEEGTKVDSAIAEREVEPNKSAKENITDEMEDSNATEDSASIILAKPNEEVECIIIVDVFSRMIKALELKDKLKEAGYTPYLDNRNDTPRVGVRFKCANHDLDSVIKEIRRKYNRKAWYLVPQITI